MKLKKLFSVLGLSTLAASSLVAVAVACNNTTKTNSSTFSKIVNVNNGMFLTNDITTKQALKMALASDLGVNELNKAIAKQAIYFWAKTNQNPKISKKVTDRELELDNELKRHQTNVNNRFGKDANAVLQDGLFDPNGGTAASWKQINAYNHTYNLFTTELFEHFNQLISINNNNQLVLATDLSAEALLQKNEIIKSTNAGDRNKIVLDTSNPLTKKYAHFFNFLVDDYIANKLPLPTFNFEFKYDSLANQSIYNKKLFTNIPTNNQASNAYPFFLDASTDATKLNTTSHYVNVVKLINENKHLDANGFVNVDIKENNNVAINQQTLLLDQIKAREVLPTTNLAQLGAYMLLFNTLETNFKMIDKLDETNPLLNFVLKSEKATTAPTTPAAPSSPSTPSGSTSQASPSSPSSPAPAAPAGSQTNSSSTTKPVSSSETVTEQNQSGYVNLFYPLKLGDNDAFTGYLKDTIAVNQVVYVKDKNILLARTDKGVQIIGLNNFKTLKEAAAKGFSSLVNELKNHFLYQGALYNATNKPTPSAKAKGHNIKPELETYFKANQDRIIASYLAKHNNDQNNLFFASKEAINLNDQLIKIINLNNEISSLRLLQEHELALKGKVINYNKATNLNVDPKAFYNAGINVPINLTQTKEENKNPYYSLLRTFVSKTSNKTLQQLNTEFNSAIDSYVDPLNFEQLVKVYENSQVVSLDNYILNQVLNNFISSNQFEALLRASIYKKFLTPYFDLNTFHLKADNEAAKLFNQAIDSSIKLPLINANLSADLLKDSSNLDNVVNQITQYWNESYLLNGSYANQELRLKDYTKYINSLEALVVLAWLINHNNNQFTYDNLISYLKLLTANNQVIFLAWKGIENSLANPQFGNDPKQDLGFKKYQLSTSNPLNVYTLNKNDVYEVQNNEIKLKEDFLKNVTLNDAATYWNFTVDQNKQQYMNFLGLITKENQKTKVGPDFDKVSLYDKLVYTNKPNSKGAGALYGFGSKAKLKALVNSFVSYNEYKQLAKELFALNLDGTANIKFDQIVKNERKVISGSQTTNQATTTSLALNELKEIMNAGIDALPNEAFSRLEFSYVYNKLNPTASATITKANSNIKQTLAITQINQDDVLKIKNNNNQLNPALLANNQFFKMALDLAISDQALNIKALASLPETNKTVIFDKRVANNIQKVAPLITFNKN
ncbi:hypothetical protein JM47_02495 [Ureaplasma diversum]|uniref:Lipoprotein n=1 Tax=Ureaplasma diversum TaxID=42094 RepID=A0A0C5RC29_9BACT|nr:DUF3713 domain-containing protein [Ureaplasma diversum]AJQ45431.1 hypothetical protein JM47_02495 [Ureaplasma diversum]